MPPLTVGTTPPTCYFTILTLPYDHFSVETPCHSPELAPTTTSATPTHPLLAERHFPLLSPPLSPISSASRVNFLQMQTAASNGSSSRPRPIPVQNVLHVTSDDSSSSNSSYSSSDSHGSSLDFARCSRCQRTPSIDKSGRSNMVQYGLNLWYCKRCASLVGLANR